MFVIAYDLSVDDADAVHPKGVRQAYADLAKVLQKHGFERAQGSVFIAKTEDLEALIRALMELKSLPWFGACITSIRTFRMELGTDLTPIFADATA